MPKAPAFQFYARDWLASPTVSSMSLKHQGVYIRLLAASWEQDEPGTLPLPLEMTAKVAGISIRTLRDFMSKWNQTWIEFESNLVRKLVNQKLRTQAIELDNYKQKQSVAGKIGMQARWGNAYDRYNSASASASASKTKDIQPETTDTTCGNVENYSTNVKTSLMKIANQMQTYAPISDREQERRRQKQKLQLERYLKTAPARRAKM